MKQVLKEAIEYVNRKCEKNYNFQPYYYDIHHNRLEYVTTKGTDIENILNRNEVIIDDVRSVNYLREFAMRKNIDHQLLINEYFNVVSKKRTDFINQCLKDTRDRVEKVVDRANEYLNQPKIHKNNLKKLLCHSMIHPNFTEEEFETWFEKVYKKEKAKETIPEKVSPLLKKSVKKKMFKDVLDELIKTSERELTFEEFMDEIHKSGITTTTWTSDEAYSYYLNGITQRTNIKRIKPQQEPIPIPFKTKRKQQYLVADDKYPYLTPKKHLTNSFPNNRKYYVHATAPRGFFVIDLMFVNHECYLVAIELNTRKVYIEPTNIFSDDGGSTGEPMVLYETVMKDKKNTTLYLNALTKIISSGADIKYLRGDGEGAFNSNITQKFYEKHNIKFFPVPRIKLVSGKTEPNHKSLSVVDRVIRTIRDMAYTAGLRLNPTIIKQLVDIYNNAPHSTLSSIMGFDVTPNMVASDIDLETEIARRIQQRNYYIVNQPLYKLPIGVKCSVIENYDLMDKRRSKIKPDIYEIIDFKNNKYMLRNERTNKKLERTRADINPLALPWRRAP